MAVFSCKMCGAPLEINEGDTVAVCEYCGTRQTLPRLDNDKKTNFYDRANHFRRNNEYDKAAGIYEQILNEDRTDAEAYWSLVLCRYGIEYVEDPASHERIPTVNRAQFTSVLADEDYKSALKYADSSQREIYEREAKAIDEIQKGILAISQKEEPFDVFICYKETDNDGRRTRDSVLANDLYYQLTQEGFKVFFSRITLEDKLGTAYEPYIFAALNSAKVMVVVGTKAEYFNAVWVKNEWSRYLALIKNGAKKTLIPAYRDMDPYDLPEEFSHLQAQDMSKLGFMQDLIRGIKKIVNAETPRETVRENNAPAPNGSAQTESLLKRAFMFLEDGNWQEADTYCERILDMDPENARAYLGKLMAELHICRQEELKNCKEPFDGNGNYQKAVRFADKDLAEQLQADIAFICERNEKAREKARLEAEQAHLESLYQKAQEIMRSADHLASLRSADTDAEYRQAAEAFGKVSGYRDADEKQQDCLQKADESYKANVYYQAVEWLENGELSEVEQALTLFQSIPGWKDADEKITACQQKIEKLKMEKEECERKKAAEAVKRKKQFKRISLIAVSALVVSLVLVVVLQMVILPLYRYQKAEEMAEAGDFSRAADAFEQLGDYRDASARSLEMQYKSQYKSAEELLEKDDKLGAAIIFASLGDYQDALDRSMKIWREAINRNKTVSTGYFHTVGVHSDGTVVAVGPEEDEPMNDGQFNVSDWTNIVEVAVGSKHTVGLRSDGTVVAVGINADGQCDVSGWSNIIAVAAGDYHTVGLCSDGSVVAAGCNGKGYSYSVTQIDYGQCDVSDWENIIAVAAGGYHTVGLRSDGTVMAVGNNDSGKCNVSNWENIIAVAAGDDHTVGLCSDGTVVAVGDNDDGQCEVSGWSNIVAVAAGGSAGGDSHTVGLRSDGTVLAVGCNSNGQCDVSGWSNIVAVAAGGSHTVGLRSDGTVVAVGNNYYGQCDVSQWKNIRLQD